MTKQQRIDALMKAPDDATWAQALDLYLLDTGRYTAWLRDKCRGVEVSEESARKLANAIATGRPLNATPPWAVPELLHVLLTETPDVAMRARAMLRERYLAEHSAEVSEIAWRLQDAARELIEEE